MDFAEQKKQILSKNPFTQNTDLAYQLLLDQIIDGTIDGGVQLSQNTLAIDMGMSRTPIREALVRLQADGYLKKDSGQYYSVCDYQPDEYIQIMDFRLCLESFAARTAAMFISPEQLKKLEQNMLELRDTGSTMTLPALIQNDMTFHWLIVQASNNKHLIDTYRSYETKLRFYRMLSMKTLHLPTVYHSVLQRHYKIYKAIMAHDEDAAEDGMKKHLSMMIHRGRA